jgi:ABC-type Fe3+/spermidine/putrescine transport system ATPase subunit
MLHSGQIVRAGTPTEVWTNPGSTWVAEFLGLGNVIEGNCKSRNEKLKMWNISTTIGNFDVKCAHKHKVGDIVHLLLRPAHFERGSEVRGRVADVLFQQERYKIALENGLYVYVQDPTKIGQKITVKIEVKCLG